MPELPPPTTAPEIDPQLLPALTARARLLPRLGRDPLARAREVSLQGLPGDVPVDLTAGGRILVEEMVAPGPPGHPEVPLLVLRPAEADRPGTLPAICYVHGGGMVMGDRRSGLPALLGQVLAGTVVVSVDYRLAPEHPDPAPVEDVYAGLVWTVASADRLGIDPGRVVLLGPSAGGGLAAGAALLARDRGGPALSHLVLIYPMLDDRMVTASSQMLDQAGLWDRQANAFGWSALLGDRRGGPEVSPYAAPARATDLAGLPPTYLEVGGVDLFRDETLELALRLSGDGVPVELHLWPGAYHASEVVSPEADVSRRMLRTRADYLERALRG